ncbi:MAG: hypothetical protein ACMG6E_00670 [Candidatus Roizmanbacteria bacterium]
MNLINIFAFLSTALGLYALSPYVSAILAGKTKPHQLGWLVFVIMNGIILFSQYFEGARASILITLTFFVGSVIIFLLSLKYGVRDSSKWDRLLFAFALCTIVVWFLTRNNALAIWLTLLIDVAATSMTVLKVKADPYSEDPYPWIVASVAYVFSCLTLIATPLGILYVRPVYGLLCDATLVAFIYFFRAKMRKDTN